MDSLFASTCDFRTQGCLNVDSLGFVIRVIVDMKKRTEQNY